MRRRVVKTEKQVKHGWGLWILLGACVLVGTAWGLQAAGKALWTICNEQCRIEDASYDVVISAGKMISPEVIIWQFGLTNGANLATIDFASKRAELLSKLPAIRDLTIERRLPNRVTVAVHEREPRARLAEVGSHKADGRVTDAEGVVFAYERNVSTLPIIRERALSKTAIGGKLTDHAAAALRLIEVAAAPEFSDLRIQEISTAYTDYLMLTLGNYSRVKLAWALMLEDSEASRKSLKRQLFRLTKAMASRLSPNTTLWNATDYGDSGRIYANDPVRAGLQIL